MLGCLGSLLLLLPVYHITNRINIGKRLELERVLDPDLSPRVKHVRAKRLDKGSSGAAAKRGDLYTEVWNLKKTSFIAEEGTYNKIAVDLAARACLYRSAVKVVDVVVEDDVDTAGGKILLNPLAILVGVGRVEKL
jgi:hypothetical protein